ncbi:MAG: osmoprotectant transporter permease [Syntrophobacteraceae bacterium]
MKFWLLWAIDAVIASVALFFFFAGLADGSVSSFNMDLWITLLLTLAAVAGGSLWLKSLGRRGLATILLLILALPGLIYALFLLVLIVSGPRWN